MCEIERLRHDVTRLSQALAAEVSESERLRDELRRMEGFDVCTCGPCALHPQRKDGDE